MPTPLHRGNHGGIAPTGLTCSQALPGKRYPEALPRLALIRGRASQWAFPGRAWERVNRSETAFYLDALYTD